MLIANSSPTTELAVTRIRGCKCLVKRMQNTSSNANDKVVIHELEMISSSSREARRWIVELIRSFQ